MKTVESQLAEVRKILYSVNNSLDDIREMALAANNNQIEYEATNLIGSVNRANSILSDIINFSSGRIEQEIRRIRQTCRAFLDDTEDFDATP